MCTEPLALWGHTEALAQRTKKDWARKIQWLLDTRYPAAEKVVLVMGKLNTHTPSWLYETVTPEEAFWLAERLGIRFTPKHGSGLEIAGVELSVLAARCLGLRRIGSIQGLNAEVSAWHTQGKEKG
jgi:hypothetical protein